MIPGVPINGAHVERLPRCRWCGKEPEFAFQADAHDKMCMFCEALQDPILRFGNPITGMFVQFYVNPDAGLFVEFTLKGGETNRYTLDPATLRRVGVLQSFPKPLNGRK